MHVELSQLAQLQDIRFHICLEDVSHAVGQTHALKDGMRIVLCAKGSVSFC